MGKEVLTLQFGDYSNYVGAHFWNAQDELLGAAYAGEGGGELDADVLFQAGEDAHSGRATFAPRLLVFDIAGAPGLQRAAAGGSFGAAGLTARALHHGRGGAPRGRADASDLEGGGRDDTAAAAALARLVDGYARAQLPHNSFLRFLDEDDALRSGEGDGGATAAEEKEDPVFDLDAIVHCWGDFLKTRLHARSLVGVGGRSRTGESFGPAEASSLSGGTAAFDAFTDGGQLMCEQLEEPARLLLEASDGLQGIVCCVDIDSGFGSLSLEYLHYLREECPRAPMLVFGAMAPSVLDGGLSTGSFTQGAAVAGTFDYAQRDRASMRDVNVGLAFASFGSAASAGDLDATFVPLSMQAYALAVHGAARAAGGSSAAMQAAAAAAGGGLGLGLGAATPMAAAYAAWLPGFDKARLQAQSFFQSSAPLAAAWDCCTAPFRRRARFGDRLLPICAAEEEAGFGTGLHRAGSGNGAEQIQALRQGSQAVDARARDRGTQNGGGDGENGAGGGMSGNGGGTESAFDPALELASGAPQVALREGLTMREMVQLLTPAPYLRLLSVAIALPFPHPRASATALNARLQAAAPLHQHSLALMQPLSWTSANVPDAWARGVGVAASSGIGSGSGGGNGGGNGRRSEADGLTGHEELFPAPFAHVLVARGVGSHAVGGANRGAGRRYASSLDAYGRALDSLLARTRCRAAGHCVLRTPLPVPLTFPAVFPAGFYDSAGAVAGSGGSADARGTATPFSVPALSHLACTPAVTPNLARVLSDFRRSAKDRRSAVLYRFQAEGRRGGGGGLEDCESALAALLDDFAPGAD